MSTQEGFTHAEILSQPQVWAAAVDDIEKFSPALQSGILSETYDQVIFTGCGSTYYLSIAAATLLAEQTGINAKALPASELWLYPRSSYLRKGRTLLVAVSRSGYTTETVRACEFFLKEKRGDLLTISCYGDKPLASMGKVNLVLPSAQEQSVAQTRAFSTLYLATVALAVLWAGREDLYADLKKLSAPAQNILTRYSALAKKWGSNLDLDRFYFLGSGPRYGLACELNLKMKEMSLTHAEPFHFMEFRHGPKSMINPKALVVAMPSRENWKSEMAVIHDMRALGVGI
jgi:glucosamine--fructose-6-phosphate aminotransferase (isomerizing)